MDKSAKAEITLPRADRDLLILAPSLSLSPVAPVLSALSLPCGYKNNNNGIPVTSLLDKYVSVIL